MSDPTVELKGWLEGEHISMPKVELILEFLDTKAMLNQKGIKFKHVIWEMYVKEKGDER